MFVVVERYVDQDPNETGEIIRGVPVGFRERPEVRLLGLIHGHFDSDVRGDVTEDMLVLGDGRINTGIAIVVPAKSILEVIGQHEQQH